MKFVVLILASMIATSASANTYFSFMKCNSMTGKTLWASFGQRKTSNDPKITMFLTELVVFASRTQLQHRQVFDRTVDALKIPILFERGQIRFEFNANSLTGGTRLEQFDLRQERSPKSYSGLWISTEEGVTQSAQVACSIY